MIKFDTQIKKLLTENSKEQPIMTVDKYGTKEWRLKNGKLHREGGPAVIKTKGAKEWWLNGKRHRKDGPAVTYPDGHKQWWVNGERHRIDGPAVIYADGSKVWVVNHKYHREDGPAIERADGYKEWYLNNEYLSEDMWKARVNIKKNVPPEHQQSVIDILDL